MSSNENSGAPPPSSEGSSAGSGNQQASSNGGRSGSNPGRYGGNRDRDSRDSRDNHGRRHYQPRFEGREPTLKGHIYDFTGERMPDQFLRTANA